VKSISPSVFRLSPRSSGWQLVRPDGRAETYDTVEQVSQAIPKGSSIHLALPTGVLLLDRMQLPSSDPVELAAMAELQLEKALPYPIQEVKSSISVIEAGETSSVLAIAVRLSHLDELCAPLLAKGAIVEKTTPLVSFIAASCSPQEQTLCIYRESGDIVSAISSGGKLSWAHCTPAAEAERFPLDLPRLLLTAELQGASAKLTRIHLDPDCRQWKETLESQLHAPVESRSLDDIVWASSVDLTPDSWLQRVARRVRSARMKQVLLLAGASYLALFALSFSYVGWLKLKASRLDAEYAAIRPQIEALQARQTRWNAMAPAVEPDRATDELLYQLCRNLPPAALHLTEFDQSPTQWKVVGEADSADLAVAYLGKLKGEKELSDFSISASPPTLLPNGGAQFSIFGKR